MNYVICFVVDKSFLMTDHMATPSHKKGGVVVT